MFSCCDCSGFDQCGKKPRSQNPDDIKYVYIPPAKWQNKNKHSVEAAQSAV